MAKSMFLLALSCALLLGCTNYPPEVAKELSNCNLSNYYLAGITERCGISDCVSDAAVRLKNPDVCDEIPDWAIRDCNSVKPHDFYSPQLTCHTDYAIYYSDPSLCQEDPYCLTVIALNTGNVSVCFALEDRNYTDCLTIFGKEYCENRTSHDRARCIDTLAVISANSSLCAYITDDEWRANCESEADPG
jgi:hypothetical protein